MVDRKAQAARDNSAVQRLILGSGRSGTTWVLDCLADANHLRPIFEPLHPSESALGEHFAYQVMVEGETDEVLERYFIALAAGQARSRWIDYRAPSRLLFPPPVAFKSATFAKRWARAWRSYVRARVARRHVTRRKATIIKCVRANLMAGWLTQTIGFRTVLVVRHPCAVVESQQRLGSINVWDPAPVTARYRANDKLHGLTGGRYLNLLNGKLTALQALTLNWVIENQWPVEHSQQGGYAVFHYEDLVARPTTSWPHVCAALGLPRIPDLDTLRKPSQQASRKTAEKGGDERKRPSWRSRLSATELRTIQAVLDATGCALYSTDQTEPLTRSHFAEYPKVSLPH